jgi:hypothetical protein
MSHPDPDAVERAERAVFDEQESNERATAGVGPEADDQADTFAADAERAEAAEDDAD